MTEEKKKTMKGFENPDEGLLNSLSMIKSMVSGDPALKESWNHALRYEDERGFVDTVCAIDTGIWETAIAAGPNIIIVDQYEDEEKAKAGHEKWVQELKSGKRRFYSIQDQEEESLD